jgi:hypothetical protein
MLWGQAVESQAPRPVIWIANKVYHMQCLTDLRVPIIVRDTRANLADPSLVQVGVSVITVDGRDQYREDNITLQSNAKKHDILSAWTAVTLHRGHQQPQHATFPEDEEEYKVHHVEGHDIKEIRNWMDIFVSMRRGKPEVQV